jgi:DNA-binding YbaB/EbfC family protein
MSEGFDPQSILSQAMELQEQLMAAQAGIAETSVEGTSGGGKVTITMSGDGEVTAVRIDPSVVDPAEVDLLEDLLVAAFHDAMGQCQALAQQQMNFGGLGGLGELFGGLLGGSGEAIDGVIDADAEG